MKKKPTPMIGCPVPSYLHSLFPMYPPRVVYSVLFYILLMTLVIVSKPRMLFDPNGSVRVFGVGKKHTVFPLGVVAVVAAVLSMYTFSLIDLVYG
jgi:hypothetical protein